MSNYADDFQKVHAYITDLMEKIRRPAGGLFPYPYPNISSGSVYSGFITAWDTHHMTLRYAAGGEPEMMKSFLLNLLAFQRPDGFVPCSCSPEEGGSNYPYWHAQPFLAQNAMIYAEQTGDLEFISSIYGKLDAYLKYYFSEFKAPFGLFRWGETWMSGFDNEIAGTQIPPGNALPPDIASLLYLECLAMAQLGRLTGKDPGFHLEKARSIRDAVNRYLWDEESGIYSTYNLTEGRIMTALFNPEIQSGRWACASCPSFLVLYSGIAPRDRAERMIREFILSPEHFRSRWGIRSLSKSSEFYNNARWGNPPRFGDWRRKTNSNWQGPVWIPLCWFVFHGLLRYGFLDDAVKLERDVIALLAKSLETHGFLRENFDAETGTPLYADHFASWNILADVFSCYLIPGKKSLNLFPPRED